MSERDIQATNVRPAFEASLQFGATEEELAARVGWRREELQSEEATVTGESTYRHMELMYEKPSYASFVLAATALHAPSSLGVVGLACKTVATVGEAMECHRRFQHLTNRTARYETKLEGGRLTLSEDRPGASRLGSALISDYTMLIALQLLRTAAEYEPRVLEMHSRRESMSDAERAQYEAHIGAPIHLSAPRAQMVLDAAILDARVESADAELAAYFQGVLERAAPFEGEDPVLRNVRIAIRDALVHGTPTAAEVARSLGLGQRTLQRRLSALGQTFADVLETTRRTLADGYLANPELSLSEIAYLLGYVEQSSFFRAFRRWHGTTPAAYRRDPSAGSKALRS